VRLLKYVRDHARDHARDPPQGEFCERSNWKRKMTRRKTKKGP
jgi:hypothetical protein